MKVIDMRFRPPYKSWANGMFAGMDGIEATAAVRRVNVAESARKMSMDILIQEMEEVDAVGVAPVRKVMGGLNSDIQSLLDDYPDKFIGIANIDPLATEEALAEIEEYVVNGPAKGVIVEHAWMTNQEHWFVNDERAYEVFDKLQQHNMPMLLTYGGRGVKNQEYYNPRYVDEIAFLFPKLKIVLCHGGWPYVTQAVHASVQHTNVYLSPDVYMMSFTAGYQDYITAANYQLQDRTLFGTAYPVMCLKDGINIYKKLLDPEIVDKVLYKNALRLFSDLVECGSATGH